MKYKNIILALTIIAIICFVGMKKSNAIINTKTTNNQSDIETTKKRKQIKK